MNAVQRAKRSEAQGNAAVKSLIAAAPRVHTPARPAAPAPAAARYSRDRQRARVYAAEKLLTSLLDTQHLCPTVIIHGSTVVLPAERRFADLPSMQAYADAVTSRPWNDYPHVQGSSVLLRPRKGADRATYQAGTIAIPIHPTDHTLKRWAMRETVLLHELAHHFTPRAHHGPEFVRAFITLIGTCLGPEADWLTGVLMRDSGVQF